jgi:predicted flap endonuclease-1-like 5' DNA nuclease
LLKYVVYKLFHDDTLRRRGKMALREKGTKNAGALESDILDGAALVVVSPIVVPALLLGLRSVAKTFIKGSLFLTDIVKRLAMATSEGWGDLVAEARSPASPAPVPGRTGTMGAPPYQAKAAPRSTTPGTDRAVAHTMTAPPPQAEHADLQRITGIGSRWAMLLKTAGVETVRELSRRHPVNLHEKLRQVNEQEHIVSLLPSLEQVTAWIEEAQGEAR